MDKLVKLLGIKEDKIKELINKISIPKVKEVIELRYGVNDGEYKTLKQVSEEMNISMELVRQLEARGIRFLKENCPKKNLFQKIISIFKNY